MENNNRWKVLEATLALAANLARDILNDKQVTTEENKEEINDEQ